MRIPFIVLCWGLVAALHAQTCSFALLESYTNLDIVINADIAALKSDEDEKWRGATLQILENGAVKQQFKIKVSTRGKMRKKICDFPPVKVKFSPSEKLPDSIADASEVKLKIVSKCSAAAEQPDLVMRECLIYKLYNTITDQSFRVKPAHIVFKDSKGNEPDIDTHSFFLESEKEMAARLSGRPMKPKVIIPQIMDAAAFNRTCLFEYMIGNTDWNVYQRHNIKIELLEDKYLVTVPYDFDYSGAVGAVYARPHERLPIKTVQDRYFLGICRPPGGYDATIQLFLSKKTDLLATCDVFPYLDPMAKTQLKTYLISFFTILENPEKVKTDITEHCNKDKY
jgi:hypothetical protein